MFCVQDILIEINDDYSIELNGKKNSFVIIVILFSIIMMMMMMTELNVSRFILDQWTMMMMVMILENFLVDQFGIHFRMGRITKKKNVYEWEEFFFLFLSSVSRISISVH